MDKNDQWVAYSGKNAASSLFCQINLSGFKKN
jgi:hypothetical protein